MRIYNSPSSFVATIVSKQFDWFITSLFHQHRYSLAYWTSTSWELRPQTISPPYLSTPPYIGRFPGEKWNCRQSQFFGTEMDCLQISRSIFLVHQCSWKFHVSISYKYSFLRYLFGKEIVQYLRSSKGPDFISLRFHYSHWYYSNPIRFVRKGIIQFITILFFQRWASWKFAPNWEPFSKTCLRHRKHT